LDIALSQRNPQRHLSDALVVNFQQTWNPDHRHDSGIGAYTKYVLGRLPGFLIVTMGRFTFSRFGEPVKIDNWIDFDLIWSLPGQALSLEDQNQQPTYALYGVVFHKGTLNAGHYTSSVLDGTQWLHYDDAQVTPMTMAPNHPALASKIGTPYILFYRRI
jgi:ubiquitin C-terminal hydrolase